MARGPWQGLLTAAATLALAAPASAATYTVTRTDDPPARGCTPGDCSLRAAVGAAGNGDVIAFAPSTNGTPITLTQTGGLAVANGVTIAGNGRAATVIDGGGAAAGARAITVGDGISSALVTTLRGLTITNGLDPCCSVGAVGGGAILVDHGSLTLQDVRLTANASDNGAGGALRAYDSDLRILDSTIDDNVTGLTGGGGVALYAFDESHDVLVRNTTFSGNRAVSFTPGGALYLQGSNTLPRRTVRVTLQNNAFVANSASQPAGAIYAVGVQTITVAGNAFSANTSPGEPNCRFDGGDVTLVDGGGNFEERIANCGFTTLPDLGLGDFDPSTGVFPLKATSRLRDAAPTLSGFAADAVGTSRPQGPAWDAGPYEYPVPVVPPVIPIVGGTTTPTPPPATEAPSTSPPPTPAAAPPARAARPAVALQRIGTDRLTRTRGGWRLNTGFLARCGDAGRCAVRLTIVGRRGHVVRTRATLRTATTATVTARLSRGRLRDLAGPTARRLRVTISASSGTTTVRRLRSTPLPRSAR